MNEQRKKLKDMTVAELRDYARERGFAITYLTERKRDDLVRLIGAAERRERAEVKRAAEAVA